MTTVSRTLPVASTTASLHPVRKAGSQPRTHLPAMGGVHQQLRQVLAEDRDGSFLGVGSHLAADVVLDRRGDEALVGVAGSFLQVLAGHGMLRYADLEVQVGLDVFDRSLDPEAEDFSFSPRFIARMR